MSVVSVLAVPLESTGDGSMCCGYGDAGGPREEPAEVLLRHLW